MGRSGAESLHRDVGRRHNRIPEDTSRNGREGNRLRSNLVGPGQRFAIARGEQIRLTVFAAVPHRPHRVYDPARRKIEPWRDLRLPRLTPAQSPAVFDQLGPRSPMNSTIHPATPQQRVIGRVHDGINILSRDVPKHQLQAGSHTLFRGSLWTFT